MTKVCINPHCDEVALNCSKEETHCRNCDCRMIAIHNETYEKHFRNSFFQRDYKTGEMILPPAHTLVIGVDK